MRFCPSVKAQDVIPITLPYPSTKGPPLFPFEIGAVVCINSNPSISREAEEIIPSENVPVNPRELPSVYALSPVLISSLLKFMND